MIPTHAALVTVAIGTRHPEGIVMSDTVVRTWELTRARELSETALARCTAKLCEMMLQVSALSRALFELHRNTSSCFGAFRRGLLVMFAPCLRVAESASSVMETLFSHTHDVRFLLPDGSKRLCLCAQSLSVCHCPAYGEGG